jgi:chaperonin GroES
MKKVHIDPLSDRVVVMPEEADEKTASGIILPDTAKEKPQMGKILAAGPGKVSENGNVVKMTLKAGDRVLYGKYSGTEVTLDDNEVLIMRESDILAKYNN